MIEMLYELGKLAPVIAVLVIAVLYFLKREKKNELEIKSLNEELRQNERDNLEMVNKLANSLDKIATTNESFHQEIQSLKEFISLKIESLK